MAGSTAVVDRPPLKISIPYAPRNWAKKMHASFKRWLIIVLHRRAGKTTGILNHHQRAALDNEWEKRRLNYLLPSLTVRELHQLLKRRTYWHVMPTFHQAKLTGAWDTLKEISRPIPGIKANEAALSIVYPNGNRLQLIGAADPDALRGPALSGLSLDEYSQIPANAFGEVLSKALADHLGYCIWAGTIKGMDQLYRTYEAGKVSPDWFALWQDVDMSLATEEGATINALRQAMEDDRKLVLQGMMTQAEFDQEWYLSADAAIKGAFYADEIKAARIEGRITRVMYDPALPVDTDWDLGIDAMAIWFSQSTRSGEVRLIDYHEDIGGGLIECIKALKGQQANPTNDPKIAAENSRRAKYIYGQHRGPHDIEVREISSGTTRKQTAAAHGVNFLVTRKLDVQDGIQAAKLLLQRCWFDEAATARGLECLRHYRKTYQQKFDQFTATPVHDWASHGADAFRGLAVNHRIPQMEKERRRPPQTPVGAWT